MPSWVPSPAALWVAVWVVLVLPLAVPEPALGQVASANVLTLQAAVERALAANATIAAARLIRPINQAGLAVAAERLNPEASIELAKETPRQALGLSWPVELGGKRSKRIAVGEATINAGEAELAATIAQVRNDVRRGYYDAVVASERLTVLRELRDLSQRVRDTAQTRFESGDAPRLEVLQANLALAAAENETIAAEGALVAARTKLNALLAQPLDASQALVTPLDAGPPPGPEAAVTLARAGSSELTVIDRQIDEERAKVSLAEALRVPDLTPSATVTHDAQPDFTYGWRAGVAVTVPVLTTHKAGVRVEQATLERLIAQRLAALVRITGDVTAAATSAEAQRQTYLRYRDVILPQAREVEQLAQDSYQLGRTGIAALLQALQSSRDIRLRSIDAASQFQTALADLERAIGAPLP